MAVQFSTGGDSLANATTTAFFQSSLAPSTISVWINADWLGTAGARSYVGMYNATGGTAVQIGTRLNNQIDIWTWGGFILISSIGITVPSNTWIHVTYTFDGTSHRLYVNGVLNNTTTNAARPQIAGNFNMVFLNGYVTGATNETGTFQVDTYDYFNRALSSDEVMTVYSAAGNRHGIVYGCIVRYEFDEGVSGSTVSTIYNQTAYDNSISNLISNSTRTPEVTYSPGYVSGNLRPPLG